MKEKMLHLRRVTEVVKKKNENSILQSVPQRTAAAPLVTRNNGLTTAQGVKFRAHLKDQELVISKLVETVENLQLKSRSPVVNTLSYLCLIYLLRLTWNF